MSVFFLLLLLQTTKSTGNFITSRVDYKRRFNTAYNHLFIVIVVVVVVASSAATSSTPTTIASTISPLVGKVQPVTSSSSSSTKESSTSIIRSDGGLPNTSTVAEEQKSIIQPPPPPPLQQEPFLGRKIKEDRQQLVENEKVIGITRQQQDDSILPPPPPILTERKLSSTKSASTISSNTTILPLPPPPLQQSSFPQPPPYDSNVCNQLPPPPPPPPLIKSSVDKVWRDETHDIDWRNQQKIQQQLQQRSLYPDTTMAKHNSQVPNMRQQQQQMYVQQSPMYHPKTTIMLEQKRRKIDNKAKKLKHWIQTVSSGMKVVSDALDKSLDTVVDQTTAAWTTSTKKIFSSQQKTSTTTLDEVEERRRRSYQTIKHPKQQTLLHPKVSAVKYLRNGGDSSSSSSSSQSPIYTKNITSSSSDASIQKETSSLPTTPQNSEKSLPFRTLPQQQQEQLTQSQTAGSSSSITQPTDIQQQQQQQQQYPMFDGNSMWPRKSSIYNQKGYQPQSPLNYQDEATTTKVLSQPRQQQSSTADNQMGSRMDATERNMWQQPKTQYNYYDDAEDNSASSILRKIKKVVLRDIPELIVGPFQMVYSKLFRDSEKDEYGAYHEDSWATTASSSTTKSANPLTWIQSFLRFSKKEEEDWPVRPRRQASPRKVIPPTTADSRVPKKILDLISTTSMNQQKILSNQHNKHKNQQLSIQKCYPLVPLNTVQQCRAIGRNQAFMDVVALGFTLIASYQLTPYLSMIFWNNNINNNFETWAPFALCAAGLTVATNHLESQTKLSGIKAKVIEEVGRSIEYAQLWLRLVTSVETLDSSSSETSALSIDASHIASSQIDGIVARRRLRLFTTMVILGGVLLRYTSFLAQLGQALMETILLLMLPILTSIRRSASSPPMIKNNQMVTSILVNYAKESFQPLLKIIQGTIWEDELWVAIRKMNLSNISLQLSLPFVLLASSFLPTLGRNLLSRQLFDGKSSNNVSKASMKISSRSSVVDSDSTSSLLHRSHVASLGSCSSSRLQLLSQDSIEAVLDRWQILQPSIRNSIPAASIQASLLDKRYFNVVFLQKWLLICAVALLSTLPLSLVFLYGSEDQKQLSNLSSMAVMLLFNFLLTKRAINYTLSVPVGVAAVIEFISSLAKTVDELLQSTTAVRKTSITATSMAAYSPKKGITVTDLWAAHSAKRAWAVQGANLKCKSGELVLILGDEGSGKSRMLTAIAEILLEPPKRARSTTYVRGKVYIGGIDSSDWDRSQLQHYVGVVLNDVGCVAKAADLVSGSSLEDILDPSRGGISGQREKTAVAVALQLTGLSTSLLPRLPSKLSTVVTTHEDEITPHLPARPLSPSEWGKLFLTRALARCILNNDNPMSSHNSPSKCMVGTVLLLDEILSQMSETEEIELVKRLKGSGAAVLLSSNRWALGRFADRIIVLKNGVVVESGGHAELLSLGRIYASRWNAMA